MKPRAAISWSGGKDCCTALLRRWDEYHVVAMLTMFDEQGTRTRSHGLRPEIIDAHADRLGLTRLSGRCSWQTYTAEYIRVLGEAKSLGVTHVIFGDIMFDAHRAWNEQVCAQHGLIPVLPLWGEPTLDLAREFLLRGGQAHLVTVRPPVLDSSWLGQLLTDQMLERFDKLGVDACGENGEYHTLVTNCSRFSSPLMLMWGEPVARGGCLAIDVELKENSGFRPSAKRLPR
jgi:diphthine-ammonia ligase